MKYAECSAQSPSSYNNFILKQNIPPNVAKKKQKLEVYKAATFLLVVVVFSMCITI